MSNSTETELLFEHCSFSLPGGNRKVSNEDMEASGFKICESNHLKIEKNNVSVRDVTKLFEIFGALPEEDGFEFLDNNEDDASNKSKKSKPQGHYENQEESVIGSQDQEKRAVKHSHQNETVRLQEKDNSKNTDENAINRLHNNQETLLEKKLDQSYETKQMEQTLTGEGKSDNDDMNRGAFLVPEVGQKVSERDESENPSESGKQSYYHSGSNDDDDDGEEGENGEVSETTEGQRLRRSTNTHQTDKKSNTDLNPPNRADTKMRKKNEQMMIDMNKDNGNKASENDILTGAESEMGCNSQRDRGGPETCEKAYLPEEDVPMESSTHTHQTNKKSNTDLNPPNRADTKMRKKNEQMMIDMNKDNGNKASENDILTGAESKMGCNSQRDRGGPETCEETYHQEEDVPGESDGRCSETINDKWKKQEQKNREEKQRTVIQGMETEYKALPASNPSPKSTAKKLSHQDASTESDESSEGHVSCNLRKIDYLLAKTYFKGTKYAKCFKRNVREHQEGYLFEAEKSDTDSVNFLDELRSLKTEELPLPKKKDDHEMKMRLSEISHAEKFSFKIMDNKLLVMCPKASALIVRKTILSSMEKQDDKMTWSSGKRRSSEKVSESKERGKSDSASGRSFEEDPIRHFSGTGSRPMRVNRDDHVQTSLSQKEFLRTPKRVDRSHGKITYHGQNDLKVFVTKKDITTIKVDAIVNAANRLLNHAGGVARVIARAAGRDLDLDCQNYIREGNTVDVTDIFVSRGGLLPAEHVLHAVGPKWEAYEDKNKCLNDLRKTVLRCLVEVARIGKSSVALPSISAAIFKVPKSLCAKCYMMAVKHFDAFNAQMMKSPLKEIHFVDVNDDMVNLIREEFTSEWEEPCDEDILKEDFHFAELHLSSKQPPGNKTATHSHAKRQQNEMGARPRTSSRSRGLATKKNSSGGGPVVGDYMIGDVRLSISTGHALDFYSDLVVIVGDPFDQISGLPDFKVKSCIKPCEDFAKHKKAYIFCRVSKPNGRNSRLMCKLHVGEKKPEDVTKAFSHLQTVVLLCKGQARNPNLSVTITSLFLYSDEGKKGKLDGKVIGTFAKSLYDELSTLSKEYSFIKKVTLVTSEEAAPHITKVLESRKLPKIGPPSHSSSESYQRDWHTPTKGNHELEWTQPRGSTYTQDSDTSESYPRDQRGHTQGSHYSESSKSREDVNTFGSGSSESYQRDWHTPTKGDQEMEWTESRGSSYTRGSEDSSSVDEETTCQICLHNKINLMKLPCCLKIVCTTCRNKIQYCPYCRKPFGVVIGDQPDGRMNVKYLPYDSAYGYEHVKAWEIEYIFPGGYQKEFHPLPGKWYDRVTRKAYLPATQDGFQVLLLLRLAFLRRLTFTIGTSVTTQKDNVITWNDIHHKTKLHGGGYGFPDPEYLMRVRMELSAREVKFENMTREEDYKIKLFSDTLLRSRIFFDSF